MDEEEFASGNVGPRLARCADWNVAPRPVQVTFSWLLRRLGKLPAFPFCLLLDLDWGLPQKIISEPVTLVC